MENKPTSEEQVVDLEGQLDIGKKMKSLVNSDGWIILSSYLSGGKAAAHKCLLNANDIIDFVRHQQAYRTLDNIEKFITTTVDMGEAARKQLYPDEAVR